MDRDIANSLLVLNDNGVIVLHDCNPSTKGHAEVPRKQKSWNGTVYCSIINLRYDSNYLYIRTVDTDHGCGMVKPTTEKQHFDPEVSKEDAKKWDYFDKNRRKLLNLISVDEFKGDKFLNKII